MSIPNGMKEISIEDLAILHHFASGICIKETKFKAGEWGEKHAHNYDHLSVLASGKVELTIDNVSVGVLESPYILTVKADKVHQVKALTDATWLCCHATDCTDPSQIDQVLIERGHV